MSPEHRVENCTVFNVRKAARLIAQLYDRAMEPAGLTNSQFSILALVRGRRQPSITGLANELGMDRTTLSRNLRLLERRGLVRTAPGSDARTRTVSTTAAGSKTLASAMPLWQEAQAQLVGTVGRREWSATLGKLRNLSRQGETLLANQERA